ncbi:MAG: class I SAM-dependent methyltransferase [Planctomycetota bacterium]
MAVDLRGPLALLRAPGNALGFLVRRRLRWSRGECALANEDKAELFPWLVGAERDEAEARERELATLYELAPLHARSTQLHYCENLALLDGLERLFADHELPAGALHALDVGCGLFQYATALQRFLALGRGGPRRVELRGVELDVHGIHRDGHSRADHARAHARLAGEGVRFEETDVTRERWPAQDVVTLFYPFLTRRALLAWGLPLAHFRPRELLSAAAGALRPGGLLVVANQTDAEHELLHGELRALALEPLATTSFASRLVPYAERTVDRVGTLWRRR